MGIQILQDRASRFQNIAVPYCPTSDSFTAVFLLKRNGDVSIGRKTDRLTFNLSNQAQIKIVMMALMFSFPAILLCQLDPIAFDAVDSANMNTVRTDDFGMLFDFRVVNHFEFL